MKFRKKPIVIEAEQWFPGKEIEGVFTEYREVIGCQIPFMCVYTLEGKMDVKVGDWIITGIECEKYPCRDSIFRATYEPVDGEWPL